MAFSATGPKQTVAQGRLTLKTGQRDDDGQNSQSVQTGATGSATESGTGNESGSGNRSATDGSYSYQKNDAPVPASSPTSDAHH